MSKEPGEMLTYPGGQGDVQANLVRPEGNGPWPAVIVIHEIWGLSEHIKQVAGRFASAGYVALAPNLFSRPDLAPVMQLENIADVFQFNNSLPPYRMGDHEFIQSELSRLSADRRERIMRTRPVIMGGMPRGELVRDLVMAVDFLRGQPFVNGKIGSVGFCFGGGMSLNLACHTAYNACVVFYGENPNPIELVEKITCPVMGIYGADDTRINIRLDELVGAMAQYRKNFEMKIYTGAAHAFFNETNKNGYREAQATDAWGRVLRFFEKELGS